jgi:hypothetical protein
MRVTAKVVILKQFPQWYRVFPFGKDTGVLHFVHDDGVDCGSIPKRNMLSKESPGCTSGAFF